MLKIPKKTCGQVLWQADGVSLQFKRCLVADGYWRGGAHVGLHTKIMSETPRVSVWGTASNNISETDVWKCLESQKGEKRLKILKYSLKHWCFLSSGWAIKEPGTVSGRASSRARQRSRSCSTSAAFQMLYPRCFDQGKWHGKDRKLTWGEMDAWKCLEFQKGEKRLKYSLKYWCFGSDQVSHHEDSSQQHRRFRFVSEHQLRGIESSAGTKVSMEAFPSVLQQA